MTPQIFADAATVIPATYTPAPPARQFLVENLGAIDLQLTWNGGTPVWVLRPGMALGMYLKGGVTTFTVSTSGGVTDWQAFLQD